MKDIRKIHREAIELAKEANQARLDRNESLFLQFMEQAYHLEKEAADELISHPESEPTRGVLFRSAASMAFNIGKLPEAKALIETALSGKPFPEIKAELEELQEKVTAGSKNHDYRSDDYGVLNIARESESNYGLQQPPEGFPDVEQFTVPELFKSLLGDDVDLFNQKYSRIQLETVWIILMIVPDQNTLPNLLQTTFQLFQSHYQQFDLKSVSQARTLLYLTALHTSRRYLGYNGLSEGISFANDTSFHNKSVETAEIEAFFSAVEHLSLEATQIVDLFLEGKTVDEISQLLSISTRKVLNFRDQAINLLPDSKP